MTGRALDVKLSHLLPQLHALSPPMYHVNHLRSFAEPVTISERFTFAAVY